MQSNSGSGGQRAPSSRLADSMGGQGQMNRRYLVSEAELALLVMHYLKESKFEASRKAFAEEAKELLGDVAAAYEVTSSDARTRTREAARVQRRTGKKEMKSLWVILSEYISLKEEKQLEKRFVDFQCADRAGASARGPQEGHGAGSKLQETLLGMVHLLGDYQTYRNRCFAEGMSQFSLSGPRPRAPPAMQPRQPSYPRLLPQERRRGPQLQPVVALPLYSRMPRVPPPRHQPPPSPVASVSAPSPTAPSVGAPSPRVSTPSAPSASSVTSGSSGQLAHPPDDSSAGNEAWSSNDTDANGTSGSDSQAFTSGRRSRKSAQPRRFLSTPAVPGIAEKLATAVNEYRGSAGGRGDITFEQVDLDELEEEQFGEAGIDDILTALNQDESLRHLYAAYTRTQPPAHAGSSRPPPESDTQPPAKRQRRQETEEERMSKAASTLGNLDVDNFLSGLHYN